MKKQTPKVMNHVGKLFLITDYPIDIYFNLFMNQNNMLMIKIIC
jgi:hypothetical protein